MLVIAYTAGFDQLIDVTRQDFADAGNLFQPAFLSQNAHIVAKVFDGPCGTPVGPDAKRIFSLHVKQVGDLQKCGADLLVVHKCLYKLRQI